MPDKKIKPTSPATVAADAKPTIKLPEEISVRSFSSLLEQPPTTVISKLIANGVMANINQNIDYDTAALLAEDFGFVAEPEQVSTNINKGTTSKDAVERPPIVTIMGHVDHGKTSLLDYIRSANVAAGESGGITQHISAYQIEFKTKENDKRKITFVDTPGHEAFSALRSHGASLTDIVILVVAADDGVKPQTIEAIEHAKKANVKIIVAINKTDLPGANTERVKSQLAEHDLIAEEYGGQTVMVPVSAKSGDGVDNLLELIILIADLLELKADPDALPEGIVIEANLDKQVGPLATVLVYNGTLHPGQVVVVGKTYGRIRTLENDQLQKVPAAGPAMPVRLVGLKDVPNFGERLEVVPNEKVARSMTQSGGVKAKGGRESENTYRIVLKADVGGSLAALEDSISKLKVKDAVIEILSSGIGQVNENDINLAKPAGGAIISFRLPPNKRLQDLAEKEGVPLKEYWIIYDAIEFLQAELKRIATPVYVTVETGRLKVLEVFGHKAQNWIVGGDVLQGELKAGQDIVITRSKEEVGPGKANEIRVGKLAVDKSSKGEQCGVNLDTEATIEKGDVLTFTETVEEK